MRGARLCFFLSALSLAIQSCRQAPINVDPFYTNKGEFDDVEIPLVKPYKLIKLNGTNNWMMNSESSKLDLFLNDVRKVNVINENIYIFCADTYMNGEKARKEVWIVVNSSKRLEKGFTSYTEYIAYLNKIGITQDPILYDVNSVAEYSGDHLALDWAELNRKMKK